MKENEEVKTEKKESKFKKFITSKPVKLTFEIIKGVALFADTALLGYCLWSSAKASPRSEFVSTNEVEVKPEITETV